MKRGFTLVEMLIVVAVLVTLMTITFRLSSIGGGQGDRAETISRMQRLENCLSGYYAAYGSYPQVKVHGSQDWRFAVNSHGIQSEDQRNENIWGWYTETGTHVSDKNKEARAWEQVRAACKAQPVDCQFPYPSGYSEYISAISAEMNEYWKDSDEISQERKQVFAAGFDDGVSQNAGRHSKNSNESDWRYCHLFKFGLMSFLLPRYLIMMDGGDNPSDFFGSGAYAQWEENNQLPAHPFKGSTNDWNWVTISEYSRDKNKPGSQQNTAALNNIPSQAVCSRWLPNLEKICFCTRSVNIFNIELKDPYHGGLSVMNAGLEIYSPDDTPNSSSTSQQYILDCISLHDGWENEFFYHSPPPYQSYTLWSAGPNGRTFPPWELREELSSDANKCIGYWIEDDIVHLSN